MYLKIAFEVSNDVGLETLAAWLSGRYRVVFRWLSQSYLSA